MALVEDTMIIERADGSEIEVTVSGEAVPFRPGNYTGPFESSFPDEGGFIEDICATFNGEDIELTEKEQEQAHELLMKQNPREPGEDY